MVVAAETVGTEEMVALAEAEAEAEVLDPLGYLERAETVEMDTL